MGIISEEMKIKEWPPAEYSRKISEPAATRLASFSMGWPKTLASFREGVMFTKTPGRLADRTEAHGCAVYPRTAWIEKNLDRRTDDM
jgi:hypothetical protein